MAEDFAKHFDSASDVPIEEQEPQDEFAKHFDAPVPTAGEQLGAAARTAVGGAVEGGGMVAGAITGAKIGTAVLPGWGTAAGTIIGAGIGWYGGSEAREVLEERGIAASPEDLPEELRPAGYAGEVVGGAASFGGAPFVAAKAGIRGGTSLIGRWIDGIIQTSIKSPKTFAAVEASAATSSAIASGVAETVAPGETGIRITSEIAAGVLNPTRMIASGSSYVVGQGRKVVEMFSPAARETAVGKALVNALEEGGEDPVLIARLLKEEGLPGVDPTSAQKVGSPTLGAMEKSLAEYSANFAASSKKTAEDSMEGIRIMIRAMSQSGDPDALKVAAKMRQAYFRTMLNGRIKQAEHTATTAAAKVTGDIQSVRNELSKQASDALDDALRQSRQAESELWDKIPQSTAASVDSLASRYAALKSEMLQEESMPAVIEGFIKRMDEAENITDAGEIIKFRKRALALAREASDQGKHSDARVYGQLAEAALEDLDTAFTNQAHLLGEGADAYDAARQFSNELNDAFTRSFAGKSMATGKYGAKMPPELMLRRALATGKEAGALQMRELEEATRFMFSKGLADDVAVNTMLDAQERLLRLTAANVIDAETGRVGTKQLAKFIRDNGELMDRFPAIKADLEEALTSEQARKSMENMVKKASAIIDKKAAFSRLADGDPVVVAGKALTDADPESAIKGLVKVAKHGKEEAIGGLRTSVFDAAIRKSTSDLGNFNLKEMHKLLFDAPVQGRKSVIEAMKANGAISKDHVKVLEELFEAAGRISIARDPGVAVDVSEDTVGVLMDALIRVGGAGAAKVATKTAGVGAHELIVAGAGSRAAQAIFKAMPARRLRDVFIHAMEDPKFAAMLIEKTPTETKKLLRAQQVHAYLLQAGLFGTEDLQQSPEQR